MFDKMKQQSGFTLIEALIAFVVLTVGILGTLIFHSTLLKESGDNKARLEAIKIAEDWIEERRSLGSTSAAYTSNIANLTASSATVTGTTTTYTVSWASSSLASGASTNTYKVDLSISWPESTQPVQLSSYFGFLDPNNTISPEDAADGSSGSDYTGSIKIPTGTLKEIPRIQIVELDDINNATASRAQDSLVIYENASVAKVAIQIEDDVYVQLAELQSFDNEIMTISGRVYLNQESAHDVDELFGPVYGVVSAASFSNYDSSQIELLDDNLYWLNNIIDIRASAGASCVMGRFKNTDDNSAGIYGDYLCVAGTGWNGSIKPYHRQYYFDDTRGSFGSRDIEIDGLVCGPANRSYRYYTLQVSDVDALDTYLSQVGDSITIQEAISNASATVVGQSGLVRFYSAEAEISNNEGVTWDSFFWHNPNYIISPAQQSGYFALTPSVGAPSTVTDGSTARYCYKVPKVVSRSAVSYQINYPGDVAHQNFYVADPGTGGSRWDCDSVWANFKALGADNDEGVASSDYDSLIDGGVTQYEYHGHLIDYGMPGYTGDSAFYPEYSAVSADEADYNKYDSDSSTGAIILGYTLATESIEGYLQFRSDLSSLADFSLGGNPEPVISVECNPNESSLNLVGSVATYSFSCAVPKNWSGYIFAFDKTRTQPACNGVATGYSSGTVYPDTDGLDYKIASVAENSDQSGLGEENSAVRFYFESALGLGNQPSSVSEFSFLSTEYRNTGADSVDTVNFGFGSGSCDFSSL